MTWEERFWAKVDASGDCWVWTSYRKQPHGYGRTTRGARGSGFAYAHRIAYELLVGPVPAGLTLDHLCRNPPCVNPDHLEPVTRRVNVQRGMAPNVRQGRTGLCRRDHPLEDAWFGAGGRRVGCKSCQRAARRTS